MIEDKKSNKNFILMVEEIHERYYTIQKKIYLLFNDIPSHDNASLLLSGNKLLSNIVDIVSAHNIALGMMSQVGQMKIASWFEDTTMTHREVSPSSERCQEILLECIDKLHFLEIDNTEQNQGMFLDYIFEKCVNSSRVEVMKYINDAYRTSEDFILNWQKIFYNCLCDIDGAIFYLVNEKHSLELVVRQKEKELEIEHVLSRDEKKKYLREKIRMNDKMVMYNLEIIVENSEILIKQLEYLLNIIDNVLEIELYKKSRRI